MDMYSLPLGMFLHEGRSYSSNVLDKFMVNIVQQIFKETVVFAVTTDTKVITNKFVHYCKKNNSTFVFY